MAASVLIRLVLLVVGLPQEDAASTSVVAPGAKLEKVWGEGSFTEGGALDQDGSILFSDIGNRIMRFDPNTGKTTVFREPSGRANGLIFDGRGRLIVAEGANTGGGRRVSITERDGKIRTLADNYDNKRFNSPNDVAVDRDGRVYVSDPRYVGDEPRELDFEGVFLIDFAGVCHSARDHGDKAERAGALARTKRHCTSPTTAPGGRVLIAADRAPTGKVGRPRVIHDFGSGRGIDGMTVTTDGRIVAAAGSGDKAGVVVLSPDGKILAMIPIPEDPANVEFGGADGKTLYICAGKSLYRIATTMTGYHLWPPRK